MPRTVNPQINRLRRDSNAAQEAIIDFMPNERLRMKVLRVLANSIQLAHRIQPASWNITLWKDSIRLNVGGVSCLTIGATDIQFAVTGRLLSQVPSRFKRNLTNNGYYDFVNDAKEYLIPTASVGDFKIFQPAHADLIERAANARTISSWQYAHSPSVIAYLNKAEFKVDNPSYYKISRSSSSLVNEDQDESHTSVREGSAVLRQHYVYERRSAGKKKRQVLNDTGTLSCQVCGFDFEKTYGSVGYGFAEVHHLVPMGETRKARQTKMIDLAIVCSNCHRILHRGNPLYTIAELKRRLKKK